MAKPQVGYVKKMLAAALRRCGVAAVRQCLVAGVNYLVLRPPAFSTRHQSTFIKKHDDVGMSRDHDHDGQLSLTAPVPLWLGHESLSRLAVPAVALETS
jgi:hypothetical protein